MKDIRQEKEAEEKKEQGKNLIAQLLSMVKSGLSLSSLLSVLSELARIIKDFALSIADFTSLRDLIYTQINQWTNQSVEVEKDTQAIDKKTTAEEFKKFKSGVEKLFSEIDKDERRQLFSNVSNSLKTLRNKEAPPEEKKISLDNLKKAFNNEEEVRSSLVDHHENIMKWENSINELEAQYKMLKKNAASLSQEDQKYLENLGTILPERKNQLKTMNEEWHEMAEAHVMFQGTKKYCEKNNIMEKIDDKLTETFSQEPSNSLKSNVAGLFHGLSETPREERNDYLKKFSDKAINKLLYDKCINNSQNQDILGEHTKKQVSEKKTNSIDTAKNR